MILLATPSAMIASVFSIYMMEELRQPSVVAGLVGAVYAVACIFSRMFVPKLEQKIGLGRTIKVAFPLFLGLFLPYIVTTDIRLIFLLRFVSGICYAISHTSLMSIGIQCLSPSRKNEGIAYLSAVGMTSLAIGPYIGINVLQLWGYHGLFLFSCLAFVPGVVLLYLIRLPKMEHLHPAEQPEAKTSFISKYLAVEILPLCFAALILAGCFSTVTSFIAAYALSMNLFSVSAYYFLFLAGSAILTRLASGKISRLLGEMRLVYLCYLGSALGYVVLSLARGTVLMMASAVLIGASAGFITPTLQIIAVRNKPQNRVSLIAATYMTFMDLGSGLGTYMIGALIPLLGYARFYGSVSPVVWILPWIFLWIYSRKSNRPVLRAVD